ncbi:hypothetical protein BHS04_25285 [Myxococcus xanthus]|nr:hypothetical protein BHS04_25285 [Myxococcus xanthus]
MVSQGYQHQLLEDVRVLRAGAQEPGLDVPLVLKRCLPAVGLLPQQLSVRELVGLQALAQSLLQSIKGMTGVVRLGLVGHVGLLAAGTDHGRTRGTYSATGRSDIHDVFSTLFDMLRCCL